MVEKFWHKGAKKGNFSEQMEFRKRSNSFFILLILILSCLPLACSKKEGASTSRAAILRLNLQDGDLDTLHPHRTVSLTGRSLLSALFEGLMRVDAKGELQTAAAASYSLSPDGLVYTFTLRPHQWSNGEEVTAYHFEKAWKSALHPQSTCLRSEFFYVIKNGEAAKKGECPLENVGVKALDTRTLRIELEYPAPYFLDLAASIYYSPLFDESAEPTVFNGPFLLAEWQKEKILHFMPNASYWDKEHVRLEGIDVSVVRDGTTAFALYEKGELDMIGDPFSPLPIEYLDVYCYRKDYKSKPVARIHGLFCNTEDPLLASPDFRKALSLCIDRNALAQHIYLNQHPSVTPLPLCFSLLTEEEKSSYRNCEKAREHLQKFLNNSSKTLEQIPSITLAYVLTGREKSLAETLQQTWEKELGIKVELQCSELNVHINNLKTRHYQLGTLYRSSLYDDPMSLLSFYKEKKQTSNYSAWENRRYQTILQSIQMTGDPLLRREKVKEAEYLLMDEMPLIPLFSHNYQYLIKEEVKNLFISPLGYVDFKETYIVDIEKPFEKKGDKL